MYIRAIIENHTNGIETINIERVVKRGRKAVSFAAVRDGKLMTGKLYARKYSAVDIARTYLRTQLAKSL